MYREVTMIEVKEVLRLRGEGLPKKRIAAQLGLDPKTVRRYLAAAATAGVRVTRRGQRRGGPPGPARAASRRRAAARRRLGALCRAARGDRALARRRAAAHQDSQAARPPGRRDRVSHAAPLRGPRAAVWEDGDDDPGARRRARPGAAARYGLGRLAHAARSGKRRRFRAWIFTAVRSRHRFVYPTFEETTARAIEACEAAWEFFGGIFTVLIPDNTKAIVIDADPLAPRITPAFLEYAQARHFHIDPARVRACPRQRARRARRARRPRRLLRRRSAHRRSRTRARARRHWCLEDYGLRRHSRTQRRPLEHFQAEEQAAPAAGADHAVRHPAVERAEGRARSARRRRQGALLAPAPVRRASGSRPAPTRRSSASTRAGC